MIDKTIIDKSIQEKFPELERISFSINDKVISDFTEKSLYPFLIYQNTVDTLNRLITIYLPENSNSALLTPFISVVGLLRKALKLSMQNKNYKNDTFQIQTKQVVYKGNICSIIRIDFINRLIVLKEGRGCNHEIPFNRLFNLTWNYNNALNLKNIIEEFIKIDILDKKDIFTFPLPPDEEHLQGVLLFTNVSKFETLIRTIKISNHDLRDQLKICKTCFNNEGDEISIKQISSRETHNKPVSLIVSRSDSYKAFNNIINAGNNDLNHIKTIIIDDFDEIILKAKKSGTLEETMAFLKTNYFEKLGKGIQDIFLICCNRNFEVQEILQEYGINSFPWLLNPLEKLKLDNISPLEPEISILRIDIIEFERILATNYTLLLRWRELASTNFCNGKVILPIKNLYTLRDKWISFYDPNNFINFITEFEYTLNQLKDEWFLNQMDFGLIDETSLYIKDIKEHFSNNLLEYEIKKLIESLNQNPKKIEIVTKNIDEIDHKYIIDYLLKIKSDIDIKIKNKNDILLLPNSNESIPDLIIYLTWDIELINSSFINPIARKQVFLINSRNYVFIKNHYTKITSQIKAIGQIDNKYKLLNIDTDIENLNPEEELLPVTFVECKSNNIKAKETDEFPDIEEFVREIFTERNKSNLKTDHISNTVITVFEDGTQIEWPEHKSIYFYDENFEGERVSINNDINNLKIGNQIIVAKRGRELKKVIETTLKVKESYSKLIILDHEWRDEMLSYIESKKLDLLQFRKKLVENGFIVETDYTILNWIEGDTLTPLKFANLLVVLCKMGILNEAKKNEYFNINKELKILKMNFVRKSVQKLILSIKGINYGIDEIFDDELLNAFISYIEIKRVLGIIKK